MKRLTYQLLTTVNRGTDEEPVMVEILTDCDITCSDDGLEANLAVARKEAYTGEVTVEDCVAPDLPISDSDRIAALEESSVTYADLAKAIREGVNTI